MREKHYYFTETVELISSSVHVFPAFSIRWTIVLLPAWTTILQDLRLWDRSNLCRSIRSTFSAARRIIDQLKAQAGDYISDDSLRCRYSSHFCLSFFSHKKIWLYKPIVNVKGISPRLEWEGNPWFGVLFGSPVVKTLTRVATVAAQIGRNRSTEAQNWLPCYRISVGDGEANRNRC